MDVLLKRIDKCNQLKMKRMGQSNKRKDKFGKLLEAIV
jgi:hypothetical protein